MIGDLVADALVVLGLLIATVAVYGVARLGDPLDQLHAAGKAAFLGVVALLGAAALTVGGAAAARALLIALLLTLTAPVGAHAVAQMTLRDPEEGDAE